jgi:hypothetical protein
VIGSRVRWVDPGQKKKKLRAEVTGLEKLEIGLLMLFAFSSSSSGQCYRFPSPLYHGLIHLTAHASFALPQSHPLNEVLFLHIEKDFNEVSKTFKKDDWTFNNAFECKQHSSI